MAIPKLVLFAFLALSAIFIFGQKQAGIYIEAAKGELPIIISVPHDGDLEDKNIPQRVNTLNSTHFSKAQDRYTKQIALDVADKLEDLTGQRPYLVINRLHRKYMDPNRPATEAYEHPLAKKIYDSFQQALKEAVGQVRGKYQKGILLDIHGQTEYPDDIYISSLESKTADPKLEEALARLLKDKGYLVTTKTPEKYLIDGSIIDRFGRHNFQGLDALQLEVHRRIRYDQTLREKLAKEFAEALKQNITPNNPWAEMEELDALNPKVEFHSSSSIQSDIASFQKLDRQYQNHIPLEILSQIYDKIGPKKILDVITQDPNCHLKGHNVGKVVYQKTQNLNTSMQICGYKCTNACFHGILMEMFQDKAQGSSDKHFVFKEIEDDLRNFCDQDIIKEHVIKGNCTHGLGHVVMFLADYDTDKALADCDLFLDKGLIYYCATGVFMERALTHGQEDLAKGLLYPCDSFDYPAACFRYKMRYFLQSRYSYQDTSEICLGLKDPKMRKGCFHGVGFGYYSLVEENPNLLVEVCSFGDNLDKRMCIEGTIGRVVLVSKDKAQQACQGFVGGSLKAVCDQAIEVRNFGMNRDFDLYFQKK